MIIDATTWTAFTPLPKVAPSAAESSAASTQPDIVGMDAKRKQPDAEGHTLMVHLYVSFVDNHSQKASDTEPAATAH